MKQFRGMCCILAFCRAANVQDASWLTFADSCVSMAIRASVSLDIVRSNVQNS